MGKKKKEEGKKKKEKGKNSAVIPASASSSLSSPASQEPRHRHPALAQGCSGGSAWGSPGDNPQLVAWSRERKALGLGREKTHLGGKVSKRDVQLECLAGEKHLRPGSLNFSLPEETDPYLGKKGKLSRRRVSAWTRISGETLPACALPTHRKHLGPFAPEELPQRHEHLPHPGGHLPLAGHHHPPGEDSEVQVLRW